MASRGQPRHKGRYDATLDDTRLIEVVGEVLRHANSERPATVSQSRFDQARRPAGHPDCPTARACTMRLRLGWDALKKLALDKNRSVVQTLVAAHRSEPAEHLDERHVFFALRYVARHADLEAPQRDEYAAARRQLLAAARRRGDDTLAELLPTVGQIDRICNDDWDDALHEAGLARTTKAGPDAPPPRPKGMPVSEVLTHFVKANGWWPTNQVLREFSRQLDIIMGSPSAQPGDKQRADASALLAAEGWPLPTSDKPPRDAASREIKLPAGGIPGAPSRSEGDRKWTKEACIDAMVRWLDRFPRGEKGLTKSRYRAFAKGKPDFPSPSRFDDYGGWAAIKDAARDRQKAVAARRSTGPDSEAAA